MADRIRNTDTVPAGTLVVDEDGTEYEVIDTHRLVHTGDRLLGWLRDTRSGWIVGCRYLDTMRIVWTDTRFGDEPMSDFTPCGCGCMTGEDADRRECACDCHNPDSPNYRDLPYDHVEAYSDDENERGALRQFMDEGASFAEAVAMLNGFDRPRTQVSEPRTKAQYDADTESPAPHVERTSGGYGVMKGGNPAPKSTVVRPEAWSDPEPLLEVASGQRAARQPGRGFWVKAPRTREQYDAEISAKDSDS